MCPAETYQNILVVMGLRLRDSISLFIEPSPREREKKNYDRWKNIQITPSALTKSYTKHHCLTRSPPYEARAPSEFQFVDQSQKFVIFPNDCLALSANILIGEPGIRAYYIASNDAKLLLSSI